MRGAGPVLSCIRALACLHGRLLIRAANFPEGKVGSVHRERLPQSVEMKSVMISFLSLVLKAWSSTDLLSGSAAGAPLRVSEVGRWFVGLLSPLAAFFASLSTDSFPAMFAWPGTHWMLRWGSLCFLVVLLREVMSMSVIMWPDEELNAIDAQMAAWLSTPM